MYIVRDKNTFQILHTLSADLALNLTGQQVYRAYNPGSMELLKSELGDVPDAFNVDENGFIQAKTLQQKLVSGEVDFAQVFNAQSLDPSLGFTGDPSVNLSGEPSGEQAGELDSHEDKPDLVAFVLEQNLIDNQHKADIVFGYLIGKFEQALQAKYSQGMELKILKSYMDWQDEDKPENDSRQAKYRQMKEDVSDIKAIHKPMMNRVKLVMAELKS